MIGIAWNDEEPQNDQGLYTNCSMHVAGDRAKDGCGPGNDNSGGFCPQMTLAYRVEFQSEEHKAAYIDRCNNYVNYWRDIYPSGVAVGTDNFCPEGGCLGLFLNRYDLYSVFKPDLGGSWVVYKPELELGGSLACKSKGGKSGKSGKSGKDGKNGKSSKRKRKGKGGKSEKEKNLYHLRDEGSPADVGPVSKSLRLFWRRLMSGIRP